MNNSIQRFNSAIFPCLKLNCVVLSVSVLSSKLKLAFSACFILKQTNNLRFKKR